MTVAELKKAVAEIPDDIGCLKVKFYSSYDGTWQEFSTSKPKHDKRMNAIVFSSPRCKYSDYDR